MTFILEGLTIIPVHEILAGCFTTDKNGVKLRWYKMPMLLRVDGTFGST
jgi:hypothetical protein